MADKKEAIRRRLAEMQADPKDRRHGTYTGYTYGCRCPLCTAAGSENNSSAYYSKRYLAELKADPEDPRHGQNGYTYGCRCEKCRAANSERMKEIRDRKACGKTKTPAPKPKPKPKPKKAKEAKETKAERAARWKAELEASYGERDRRSERVRALVGGEGRWRRMTE